MNNKAKTLAAIINLTSLPLLANPNPSVADSYVIENAATRKVLASFSYPNNELVVFVDNEISGIVSLINSLASQVSDVEAKNRAAQLKGMVNATIDKALDEYKSNNVYASSDLVKEFRLDKSNPADSNLALELFGLYLHAVKDFKDAENGDGTTVHVSRGTFI